MIDDLRPWDVLPYLSLPVETFHSGTARGASIALANPLRVFLAIVNNGNAAAQVSLATAPANTQGYQLTTTVPVLEISWHTHRNMVQQQWFSNTLGANLTTIEVAYIIWPDGSKHNDNSTVQPANRRALQQARPRTNGNTASTGASANVRGLWDALRGLLNRSA